MILGRAVCTRCQAKVAMDRRKFSLRVTATLVMSPRPSLGQQKDKVWRIGILETTSAPLNAANLEAFRQRLGELGYVEGRNLTLEYRSSDGRAERFPAFAKELVASKVDLIVARGTPATLAARDATDSIPVVVTATGDPLVLVSNLSHPGGNVTGMSSVTADLEAKRVGLLRDVVPGMSRIASLNNPDNPISARQKEEFQAAARVLGVQAETFDARRPEDLEVAFMAASRDHVDGIVVGSDAIFLVNPKLIADLAARYRVPVVYGSTINVDAGGLMAYGPSYPELYREAANIVAKIFRGAKPGDLPFEEPVRFELVINVGAAKKLGLTIPQSLLLQANRVIR
jgi:putative ABC transport system substrate-binding protein